MSEERAAAATGGCQCGAVRYALYVAPQRAHACHCRMCQRAVGGLFAALAGAPHADFAWTKGAPAVFQSSNMAERGFCASCGTPLSYRGLHPAVKRTYVTIGSMDDPEKAPVLENIGVESRISWVRFCEGLPERRTSALRDGLESNQA